MGLPLHTVAPGRGWRWITAAFAIFRRRPLAFTGMFMAFMVTALVVPAVLRVAGLALMMALWPMLSLGFMIATRSALAGGPVGVPQFVEGLRHPDPARRRAQWLLCAAFALVTGLEYLIWFQVDGGDFQALMRALSAGPVGESSPDIDALLASRPLAAGMLAITVMSGLTAVPFWYAPALVHWGRQSLGQALFSSTMAVWRARGAFLVHGLGWIGLSTLLSGVLLPLALLVLPSRLIGLVLSAAMLSFAVVFYVGLWFGYVDSFGAPDDDERNRGPRASP